METINVFIVNRLLFKILKIYVTVFVFQSDRRGINIDTERLTNMIVSRLTIFDVSENDAGVYICKPIKGEPCNITLSIVNGKYFTRNKITKYMYILFLS